MGSLLLFSLFACAPEQEGPASLPVAQGAGPFAIPVTATAVYPGQLATLSVSGLPSGARVTFLRSERGAGAGPCHPSLPACAGVLAPLTVLGTATVATGGDASVAWQVPPGAVVPQWLQAFVNIPGTSLAATSPVLVRVPTDGDFDFVPDAQDNCAAVANPDQLDADGDTWGEACDCDDADAALNPDAAEVPFNLIDEDCDGVAVDPWAGDYSGTTHFDFNIAGFITACTGQLAVTVSADPTTLVGYGDCVGGIYGAFGVNLTGTITGSTYTGLLQSGVGTAPLTGTFSVVGGARTFTASGVGDFFEASFTAAEL